MSTRRITRKSDARLIAGVVIGAVVVRVGWLMAGIPWPLFP